MQDAITSPGTVLVGLVDSHETRLQSMDEPGKASGGTAAHPNNVGPGSQVRACDLHPGDVVQQCDWPLHVRQVTLSQAAVAIVVTEFEFPLHYAADAQVQLAA